MAGERHSTFTSIVKWKVTCVHRYCQTAIVKEALRVYSFVTSRQPLVAPNQTLRFGKWKIAPGVSQGLTTSLSLLASTLLIS